MIKPSCPLSLVGGYECLYSIQINPTSFLQRLSELTSSTIPSLVCYVCHVENPLSQSWIKEREGESPTALWTHRLGRCVVRCVSHLDTPCYLCKK